MEDAVASALGVIKCTGLMSEFLVNLTTLRFQNYLWGSHSLSLKPADDPGIEIGACTRI